MQSIGRRERRQNKKKLTYPELRDPFDKVYRKMTSEEKFELLSYSACGSLGGSDENGELIIIQGSAIIERIENFKKEMIAKYS